MDVIGFLEWTDEQLKVDDDFDWSVFNDTSIDSFNIPVETTDSYYYRTWLWNETDRGISNTQKDTKQYIYLM